MQRSENVAVLLRRMIELIYAFSSLFIVCELGQRESLAFEKCSDAIGQIEWYLFPANIQRMLPIIINFAQQPTEFRCFGSVACDRETSKNVGPNQ